MTDLPDIIARLEKCVGPDRELDQDIFHALDLCPKSEGGCDDYRAPLYTASVDSALSLVPVEWTVEDLFWSWPNGDRSASACLTRDKEASRVHGDSLCSLAIALCIAALKARSPA